jgi:acyl carrier protein
MKEKIIQVIAKALKIQESKIKSDSKFVEDLGADSLDTVELVMILEEEFDFDIPEEDAEELITVGDVIAYVETYA